ncbi:glycosyltransferase [Rossellomorea aquimaris]|uniref:glycosyltransferase n=1 Tax=Rossellomorea aquimaris TaxID=189382 RepID=UPI001CD6B74F|nr:glycosyltransferase [Rossellomorea aquimaris]MCA1060805.1 glycosyltransferase [Rossellomorea aquimaris]
MKVLLLAPAKNVHTKKWLEYYSSQGIKVVNISLANHKDDHPDDTLENVRRIYLDLKFNHKVSYIFTVSTLKKIITEEKPDLVHSHYASSYGLIGALANFKPYIVSVWGSDIYEFPKKNMLTKSILTFALQKADYICATSPALEKETRKYSKEGQPIHITPFGVDMNKFKPVVKNISGKGFRIGLAKRMEPKYGVDYLLRGYKLFLDKLGEVDKSEINLSLAGEGVYMEEYKKLAISLGIDTSVQFLGQIHHGDIPEFITSMDVMVISSLIESFGVSAVEAQACGVPVVATNVGGLPDVVIDDQTGYIVPSKNPEAIAEKLFHLYSDASRRKRLGENGRKHVITHYDWQENSKRMSDLYNEIVYKKGESSHEYASKR